MRQFRTLGAALLFALVVPAAAQAQEVIRITQHRGLLGIMTQPVPNTPDARQRVVTSVIRGSAAEKAGIAAGDTIVRINGRDATSQVMGTPFEPGDRVVLRVRRGGRERDVTVTAEERHTVVFTADSLNMKLSEAMRQMRTALDTMTLPRIEVRRRAGDSTVTMLIGKDTITMLQLQGDSAFQITTDGRIMRVNPRGLAELPGMITDSVLESLHGLGERIIRFDTTMHMPRPGEIFTGVNMLGARAIAGAELAPLNPDLAELVGTAEGVFVLNAREGTPAERAGLRGGDVIYRVNGKTVRSIPELRRAIQEAGDGSVQLRVLRRGRNIDVTLGRD